MNRDEREAVGADLEGSGLGHFPAIALAASLGLLVCVSANALARATVLSTTLPYWAGLALIAVPIFYRLTSPKPSFTERFSLVGLLALALYGVKVGRDALVYTFSDEPIHAYNAQQIVDHHHLFEPNPILTATPHYPGLEGAASALMSMTDISSFGAGILLIGAARLTLMLALFLLFTRLSGSPRVAALGTAIYTGGSNFLFWSVQFSYQSLALPLLAVVLLAVAERQAEPDPWRSVWTIPILLGIAAVVVTHHLTSYALALTLIALALFHRFTRDPKPGPWPFAVFASIAAAAWLTLVAGSTYDYVFPVLSDAFNATVNTASGEAPPRKLFRSSSAEIAETPPLARLVALSGIALLALGFFAGIFGVLRRFQRQPFVLLLCAGAAAFFASLTLRFTPAAWETGNRAAEYFFLGLAFVVAFGLMRLLGQREAERWRRIVAALGICVVLVGGAIAGWPWDAQLAEPIRVSAKGGVIDSEPLALGEWIQDELPEGRFAAPNGDARLILSPGDAFAKAGPNPDVQDILAAESFSSWMVPLLRENDLRYVIADRREVSEDNVRAYYFEVPDVGDVRLRDKATGHKFAKLPAGRVYDSGRIVVYDLEDKP